MSNAFHFLLEQAQEREKQAALALNQARTELEGYYKQLEQIEQYRLDYCQQLVNRGMEGLTASQYNHLNKFLTRLDETLLKQKQAEAHFKQQVDNSQAHWMSTRNERKSFEWMIEKKQKAQQALEEKREQQQLDEYSTLLSARKSNR